MDLLLRMNEATLHGGRVHLFAFFEHIFVPPAFPQGLEAIMTKLLVRGGTGNGLS